jgi:hypothetical protein
MSRWIPVTEQLPDADLVVLIACDESMHNEPVWIGYYDPSQQGSPWRDVEGMPAFVTHWQPLPFPPSVTEADVMPEGERA